MDRWPEQYGLGLRGLGHAFARTIGGLDEDCAAVLEAVRGRPVPEDDGSAEWERALVFLAMVEWALDGSSAQQCLKKAAQAYLEEVFTIIANELAEASPVKVISHADAVQRVPGDQRWRDAVAFVAGHLRAGPPARFVRRLLLRHAEEQLAVAAAEPEDEPLQVAA